MPVAVDSVDNVENPQRGGFGLRGISALAGSVLDYARYEFGLDYFCIQLLGGIEGVSTDVVNEARDPSCIGVDELEGSFAEERGGKACSFHLVANVACSIVGSEPRKVVLQTYTLCQRLMFVEF